MKKVLVTILAVIYLSASIGATLHIHYCMGQLVSVALWHKKSPIEVCEKCGMPLVKKKGCCEDKHTTIKIKGDHKSPKLNFNFCNCGTSIAALQSEIVSARLISLVSAPTPMSNDPPVDEHISIFLYTCTFRI